MKLALLSFLTISATVVEGGIHEKIHEEKRFVLFNSRRLAGECLPVCVMQTQAAPVTPDPTAAPTPDPTASPTKAPTPSPTASPTKAPTPSPTASPTKAPTPSPTAGPTKAPTPSPTASPTKAPTPSPTASPTKAPTPSPTASPTKAPTPSPTASPTKAPTPSPTASPTKAPTPAPTVSAGPVYNGPCYENMREDFHDKNTMLSSCDICVDNGVLAEKFTFKCNTYEYLCGFPLLGVAGTHYTQIPGTGYPAGGYVYASTPTKVIPSGLCTSNPDKATFIDISEVGPDPALTAQGAPASAKTYCEQIKWLAMGNPFDGAIKCPCYAAPQKEGGECKRATLSHWACYPHTSHENSEDEIYKANTVDGGGRGIVDVCSEPHMRTCDGNSTLTCST